MIRPPESTSRATVKIATEGSLVSVGRARGRQRPLVGGGRRGPVASFSRASGRRVREAVGLMDRSLPALFVTMKWPTSPKSTYSAYKTSRSRFAERMRRRWRGQEWFLIGRLEFHRSLAPHVHLLVWGIDLEEFTNWACAVWPDITGAETFDERRSAVWVEQANDPMAAGIYLSKPDPFQPEDAASEWGRRWWTWGESDPFLSTVEESSIPDEVAVRMLRYMQKASQSRRRHSSSWTLLGDPAAWSRLLDLELKYHDQRATTSGVT